MSRLEDRYKSTIHKMMQEIIDLKQWRRNVTGDSPLFDIANEHTPATLNASQNNYDPGYYDVLRVNANKNISITGITKGKKGRFLEFYNVSNFKITFPNESGSSAAANRIINSSGENIVLFPTGRVRMYYDSTLSRWVIPDPPSWTGRYGISVQARKSDFTQSIPDDGAEHKLLFDFSSPDEYGMLDATNNRIIIPAGMSGMWTGTLKGTWAGPGGTFRYVNMTANAAYRIGNRVAPAAGPAPGNFQEYVLPLSENFNAGDILEFYAEQDSGGAMSFFLFYVSLSRVR